MRQNQWTTSRTDNRGIWAITWEPLSGGGLLVTRVRGDSESEAVSALCRRVRVGNVVAVERVSVE